MVEKKEKKYTPIISFRSCPTCGKLKIDSEVIITPKPLFFLSSLRRLRESDIIFAPTTIAFIKKTKLSSILELLRYLTTSTKLESVTKLSKRHSKGIIFLFFVFSIWNNIFSTILRFIVNENEWKINSEKEKVKKKINYYKNLWLLSRSRDPSMS